MKIGIIITEVATGRTKHIVRDHPMFDLETAEFYYTEGNASCNCNLATDFDGDRFNPCWGAREFTAEVVEIVGSLKYTFLDGVFVNAQA